MPDIALLWFSFWLSGIQVKVLRLVTCYRRMALSPYMGDYIACSLHPCQVTLTCELSCKHLIIQKGCFINYFWACFRYACVGLPSLTNHAINFKQSNNFDEFVASPWNWLKMTRKWKFKDTHSTPTDVYRKPVTFPLWNWKIRTFEW